MELGTRLQHSGRGSQPHTQHRSVPRHEMTRRKLAASFPHPRSRGFRGPSLWGQKPRPLRLAGSVPPGLSRLPCPGPALPPRPERPPAPWAPERWGGPVRPSRLSSARPGPARCSGRRDKGASGGRAAFPAARPTGPDPHGHGDPTAAPARGDRGRPRRLAEEGAAAATMSAAPPRSQAPGGQSAAAAARTPRPTPPTPAKRAGPGAPETRRLNAINRKSRG